MAKFKSWTLGVAVAAFAIAARTMPALADCASLVSDFDRAVA